jgi:hypothetical protein
LAIGTESTNTSLHSDECVALAATAAFLDEYGYNSSPHSHYKRLYYPTLLRPLVLFAGIRRKNEFLEIFLYYLFLVGTGTEGKNKHTVINRTAFSEAEKRGNLRRICDLTISLPTKASRNNTLFSLGLSRKGGWPFIWCGPNAQCSLRAEVHETKGRKTHAQTIYSMDTAADGTRADCDVFCTVAYGGWSRRRACDTISHHSTSISIPRHVLAWSLSATDNITDSSSSGVHYPVTTPQITFNL